MGKNTMKLVIKMENQKRSKQGFKVQFFTQNLSPICMSVVGL